MGMKEQLGDIVGADRVLDDQDTLLQYVDERKSLQAMGAHCVTRPKNTEEVQKIVKWANRTLTPLVPVSSGPLHLHGGAVPSAKGSVIVDLHEMKRIIRVDRRNMVAMLEPGVTFSECIAALSKADLAPFLPLAPRKTKSVVASWLEREPITASKHHWEPQDPLICVETIYGSGDLFRTGSAAGPGTLEEQWEVGRAQMRGMGPAQVDFVKLIQGAQGTMGIVTWANIKCRPLPKLKYATLVSSGELEPLIAFTYKVLWKRLGTECLILNNQNLASILGEDAEQIGVLRDALPPWILFFSADGYGVLPEERVEYQKTEFMETARSLGLEALDAAAGVKAEDVAAVLSGPSKDPFWKLRFKGGSQDIFFITTLDRTREFVGKMVQLVEFHGYPFKDIGVYIQPTIQGTNCHCQFDLTYDPQDPGEKKRMEGLYAEASTAMGKMGAFFYRPYGRWADIAYSGDGTTTEYLRRVKSIFDPNGIMNPGKLCF